jgi:hypothetical protein
MQVQVQHSLTARLEIRHRGCGAKHVYLLLGTSLMKAHPYPGRQYPVGLVKALSRPEGMINKIPDSRFKTYKYWLRCWPWTNMKTFLILRPSSVAMNLLEGMGLKSGISPNVRFKPFPGRSNRWSYLSSRHREN